MRTTTLPALSMLAVLACASTGRSVTVKYDLFEGNILPPTPWVNEDHNGATNTAPNGPGESITPGGNKLTYVNVNNGDGSRGYYSYQEPFTISPPLTSSTIWHMRARVRVDNYVFEASDRLIWGMGLLDGTKFVAIGVNTRVDGNNPSGFHRFFIANGGDRWSGPAAVVAAPASADGFYELELKRIGTGASTDTIQLLVDGVVYANNIPTYADLASFVTGTPHIRFGQFAPATYGQATITGVSFGFGEAAPTLTPEPAALSLLAVAMLLAARPGRRSN